MTRAVLPRHSLPHERTWDIASVFPSDAAWEHAVVVLGNSLPKLARFGGRLAEGAVMLADWFDTRYSIQGQIDKIYLYASMLHNVATADQAAVAKYERALALYSRTMAALAFAEPELLLIGVPTLREWIGTEPRLQPYSHYVDQLEERAPHIRSVEVEELLSEVLDPFTSATNIHSILSDADLQIPPAHTATNELVDVVQSNLTAILVDRDRELRRSAWESYADAHLTTKNTMATCLATGVKQNVFMARARHYGSALEAALQPHHVPVTVYYNLIQTFTRHLPIWHRYWRVRRRALGYDRLHVYDIKAPLTHRPVEVPFEQAVAWITEGMQPLGDDYVETLRRGVLEQRWVDIYPNQGKRAGAYSSGVQGTHPFILMSYSDDLFSLSTLAHELGHSLHSYYTWQAQPPVYSDYALFIAEVASNFNQALVRAYLLGRNRDPQFQIAVIEEAMSNFHRYFFVMPTLARFELEIHERVERGEALTADSMMTLMTNLFREGYGDEVVIDAERIGITWAEFPTHLYSNFYVFQYATGISAAHALAAQVLTGDPAAAARYRSFLAAGSSVFPIEALRRAGVDMTSPEPVEQTFGTLRALVDRLEELTA